MCLVVLEPVEVLVPLAADIALVRLFLFHAERSRIGGQCRRVDDGEGAVRVLLQILSIVAVLKYKVSHTSRAESIRNEIAGTYRFVILESVLVLVCLLASNHRASEWFGLFTIGAVHSIGQSNLALLFSNGPCQITVRTVLRVSKTAMNVVLIAVPAVRAEKTLRRLIYAKVQ